MSDKEQERGLWNNPKAFMEAIKWQNIKRIADELEISAAEVGSAYWVTQAEMLRSRALFEEECLKGIEWNEDTPTTS